MFIYSGSPSDLTSENWLEYKPKQYLSKQTAIELLAAQERMIQDLERKLAEAQMMLRAVWLQ